MPFSIRPRIRRAFRLALRRRDLTEREIDEEMRFHVESRVEQLVTRGVTREEAYQQARHRFGISWEDAMQRVQDAAQARESRLRTRERLDAWWGDLSYASRTLARQPAFSLIVIATFALGIGANAAMFGVIDRLLLEPPPQVRDPSRLLEVARAVPRQGGTDYYTSVQYPFYAALATRAVNLTLLLTAAGIVAGLSNGSFACLLTDLFPTRIRFTGVALVFNISFTIFSGTAPLVATTLIRQLGSVRAPALLMTGCGLLALLGSFWTRRHSGHVLVAGRNSA